MSQTSWVDRRGRAAAFGGAEAEVANLKAQMEDKL